MLTVIKPERKLAKEIKEAQPVSGVFRASNRMGIGSEHQVVFVLAGNDTMVEQPPDEQLAIGF